MEQASFIAKIRDVGRVGHPCSRLYFGIEFCQRLLPSIDDIDAAMHFASDHRMDFTFVTPFCTDEGLKKAQGLIEHVLDKQPQSEIVINDWGLLSWLNRHYQALDLSLGRLLTKQKRGPRILNVMRKVPEAMVRHFQQCNVDTPVVTGFLRKNQVKRVELDNLLQGMRRPAQSLPGSLYIPFAYITTTRLCMSNLGAIGINKPLRALAPCRQECQEHEFILRHRQMPVDLYLRGNTQFFLHERIPADLETLNIDRIVREPAIPV